MKRTPTNQPPSPSHLTSSRGPADLHAGKYSEAPRRFTQAGTRCQALPLALCSDAERLIARHVSGLLLSGFYSWAFRVQASFSFPWKAFPISRGGKHRSFQAPSVLNVRGIVIVYRSRRYRF
jgi:hypothetical protein